MAKQRLVFTIPVERLREHIILSSIVGVLAFTLFVLTWLWDQNLWIAAVALPLGSLGIGYALLCGRLLSAFRKSESANPTKG